MKWLSCGVYVSIILAALTGSGFLDAQPSLTSEWTPLQIMQVKRVTGVQVSPDGKHVVYAVRQAVIDASKNEYQTNIHVANADGSGSVQITHGNYSCEDPQWSPDGKWIAFVAVRSGQRVLLMASARGGDVVKVSDGKLAVTSFKWMPGSDRVSYTASDGLTAEEASLRKAQNDARVVDENVKLSRVYVTKADPEKLGKSDARIWTPHKLSVFGTHFSGYDWSPDGKRLVFSGTKTSAPDDWTTARLATSDSAEPGPMRSLTGDGPAVFSPLWSPDGKWIAFVASDNPPTWPGKARIEVISAKGGKPRALAETFDGWGVNSELVGWSADSKSIYYTESQGTATRVGRLPLNGPPVLLGEIDGVATGVHLNTTRTHFGFTWETLDKGPEAHISPVERFEPFAISSVNTNLAKIRLGRTEVVHWKSKDDLVIEGLLTYPATYAPGKRYPLLIIVHGGPQGVFRQSYVASPGPYPVATFSGRGYAVLRPNPRGSSGYGKKFRYANYGDWGNGDYKDVMAGVDHTVKIGVADKERVGIMGWSYGGFMTAWAVTQTQRFKAASVGAGITNLMSFTGTTEVPSLLPDYFGGEMWDNLDLYRKHSPIFHVKGVNTPTLIQHGERDLRVPPSQGLELYNALKRQRCTTKMVIYPRTSHRIEEPKLLVDCMERNLDWFDRYVGKAR